MPSFNPFDLAVYICLALGFILGFSAGLLRSLATIFGYLAGMAVAVAAAPQATQLADERLHLQPGQNWLVLVALFIVSGLIISAVLRFVVTEITGADIGAVDRMLGAILGIGRILFVAVLVVLIFDRIIPAGAEPAFLAGSKLRPLLSEAGRQGLRSLPPDVKDYIDRLKRERGL